MRFPSQIPGLTVLTIMTALYGVIWIALEGNLTRVLALAMAMALTVLGQLAQRALAGRSLMAAPALIVFTVWGGAWGAGSGLLALFFMALKTGLHAHGPEFTAFELSWVVAQLPWWTAGGLLAGCGVGLVILARGRA